MRGEQPAVRVEVDATEPSASGNAIAALGVLAGQALAPDLKGPLALRQPGAPPFELRVHRRDNPEGMSRCNIVPGLVGTILTMTMVMPSGAARAVDAAGLPVRRQGDRAQALSADAGLKAQPAQERACSGVARPTRD